MAEKAAAGSGEKGFKKCKISRYFGNNIDHKSGKKRGDRDGSDSLVQSSHLFRQMMSKTFEPIPLSGPKAAGPDAVPEDRKVVWKKVCMIQDNSGRPYVVHPQATLETSVLMY